MKGNLRSSFRFNLVVVLGLCALLYALFFASLGVITRHGSEVHVPDVTNKDVQSAVSELERLGFEVDIDSVYDPKAKPFTVVSQAPDVKAVVKEGRTVFLTINKAEPPMTPMPNLLNVSFRSAEMILKANKLILGDTTYKPDIAKGAVLDQLYSGKTIRPGQMVPQGSRIDLVIGDGLGNVEFNVPDVIGMSYEEAAAVLSSMGLHITPIWEGEIIDSASATVYDQSPKPLNEISARNRIKEGDMVDIKIKQTATPEELEYNRNPYGAVNQNEPAQ